MSRKRVEPKTPLGKRLTEVREALKFSEREPFAEAIGLTLAMIGYYERGDRVPDAEALALYRQRFGINLNWLVCGDGEMFEAASAPLDANAARMLNGFQKLPEDLQLDLLEILRMDLRRAGLL